MGKKLIQIYFGDGKGKTTAAVGQSIRAIGAGMKVAFVQFLKPGSSSEIKELKNLPNLDVYIINSNEKFLWEIEDISLIKKECENGLALVDKLINQEKYDMIILDEILHLIENEIIKENEIIELISNKDIERVITGRKLPDGLKEIGDIITEMKKIKHIYDEGGKAKKGVDF